MPYTAKIDRGNPACLLLVLDASLSMELSRSRRRPAFGTKRAKDSALSLIGTLLAHAEKEQDAARLTIGLLTYAAAESWLMLVRAGEVERALEGLRGGLQEGSISATPEGGTTMCAALDAATTFALTWVRRHPSGFPPVVLHITDGLATDGDPSVAAARLRQVRSEDGQTLLFTILIVPRSRPRSTLCSSPTGPRQGLAWKFFDMSSPIPLRLRALLGALGLKAGIGARGFAWSPDLSSITSPSVCAGRSRRRGAGR